MKFDELNIDERILRAVEDMGFEETSPIQTQAIPAVLEGIDVIGQAQTGTGKTAAYSIPMLQKINPDVKKPQAIVLCPTRELAVQVAEEIRKLAKYMSDIKVLPVYGGQEIVRQIKSLKAGVQIIVGTPGRVMDHMRRKTVKFDSVSMVILDEADEMLDMGFREDMETILTETPEERQTVLFSATMPKPIMEIARKFQKDAKIIKVVRKELTVSNIDQFYYEVRPKNKTEILSRLIDIYNPKLSVVLCNTKRQVDELISELKGRGYFADGIHGDMKQQQRDRVMDDFRSGKTEILIATDVAARGIDVDDVDVVFCVPAIDIVPVVEAVKESDVNVGAENLYFEESGAYTGEISPNMLVDAGVKYVIIGHSERREYFAETDETVNKKVLKAFEHDLTPIICCGETLTQRKQGIYVDWIRMQIKIAFQNVTADQAKKAVIAYEPIWAIGTGETATADQAEEVCAAIRACIGEIYDAATADAIRIQYGGSMNAKNAAELLAKPDIDGGLIGGASLKPDFGQIVNA